MTKNRLTLKEPIKVDRDVVPAGTDVTDWPESKLRSLRRAALLNVESPDAEPKPKKTKPKKRKKKTDGPTDETKTGSGETNAPSSETATEPNDDDAVELTTLGLRKNVLDAFAENDPPITTVGQAESFYEENGSFAPITGIADKTSRELAVQFGLEPPEPEGSADEDAEDETDEDSDTDGSDTEQE